MRAGREAKRVLLVAPQDGKSNLFIARAFKSLGWSVQQYDYRGLVRQAGPLLMNGHLGNHAADFDFVLILKGELVSPETIVALRQRVPVALWHFDPREGKERWVVERAQEASHFFTIAKGLVPWYEKQEIRAHWLLEAADPVVHFPWLPSGVQPQLWDAGFIGTVKDVPGREEWIGALIDRFGLKFQLRGSFPGKYGGSGVYMGRVEPEEKFAQVVGEIKVNLGRDRNPEIERSYGARLFRTLACGGFLLTNDIEGITQDFGDCVGVYDSDKECVDLAYEWAEDEAHRKQAAKRGLERVHEKHLFVHRVAELVKVVEA